MRERYGLDQRNWGTLATVTIVIIAFLIALTFLVIALSTDRVQSRLLAWDIVSDDRVDITFEVRPPDDRPVVCVLRAQDVTRADVGYARVDIPGGSPYYIDTYPLRTLIPAYTAELLGCGVSGSLDVVPPQFPPGIVPPEQPWQAEQLPWSGYE
jgi:hypothetical protein